jgi:glycosidase
VSKFTANGRNERENEAFNFVKTLANFRKNSSALTTGKLMQFLPQDGMYVYFRYDAQQTVMIVMSQNKDDKELSTDRFAEIMGGFTSGKEVVSGNTISSLQKIKVPAMSIQVIELKK